MAPTTKTLVRAFFAVLLIVSAGALARGYAEGPTIGENTGFYDRIGAGSTEERQRVVAPRDRITVVTTSERRDGGRDNLIVAFAPDGSVLYHDDSRRVYNDVDPVGEGATVEYVAADRLNRTACAATTDCWLNVVERVNLTTGTVTRQYSYVTSVDRGQWHDVDRVNETHLAVADIARDRVFVVNATSGVIEWEWDAQSEYPIDGGGLFPGDWTHVNDVEVLADGRIMASLRNQDQVVFLDRESGLVSNWTLGSEDDYDVLYEQHNPDYIPAERGGPAVVVADSENNRVVEYQRDNGTWNRTWQWQDVALQWPRDADRLPNAHTLIADSNGGRVIEIDADGDVVWEVGIEGAYDAERLGTGDESAGGPSATRERLRSRGGSFLADGGAGGDDLDFRDRLFLTVKELLPGVVLNGVLYVLPGWIGFVEFTALLLFGATALVWTSIEVVWSPWSVRVVNRTRES